MPGTMSVGGLASGLQTDSIISKAMEIARRPQDQLKTDKAGAQTRLAAWQDLNTRILAVKTKSDSIATQGSFNRFTADSSDRNIVFANAGANATAGIYYLKINHRAQAQQVAGQAKGTPPTPFTSNTADIGTGTISFTFTNDSSKNFDVTIDSANNTLVGARDAINRANKGVQASIINTGTTTNPSYQLLLTGTTTGAGSAFTVSGGTTALDFSTVTQNARDAEIQLGDGVDGTAITVNKSNNTVTDLIPGVTLNIADADDTKAVKIEVKRDTSGIKQSIQDFVTQYNDLNDAIMKQFSFDAQTGDSGALLGSWDLQSVQMELASVLSSSVPGVNSKFNVLASVGITQDSQGDLQVDDAQLTKALQDNPADVMNLFSAGMQSDSTYISYLSSSAETQVSGANGWEVDITQAARRAQVTAGVAMSGPLQADETLTIYTSATTSKDIKLTTDMSLSSVVEEINKQSDATGVAAVATNDKGEVSANTSENTYLTLRSVRYGKSSDVTAFSSASNQAAGSTGLGTTKVSVADPEGQAGTGQSLAGLDVEGTINGEAAEGNGQMLTAEPTSKTSKIEGLALMITSDEPITSRVYFTKGVGTIFRDTLINMTSITGVVTKAEDSLNTEIADLDKSIANMETSLLAQQDRMYTQFSQMESQLSNLQQQGTYLSAQLAGLNKK